MKSKEHLLSKLYKKIHNGKPIIGCGAGCGLSAKCEARAGADIIIIYNSGKFRMGGAGSLAGLLAFGNANKTITEMAGEILCAVGETPVLAGVNATDPFLLMKNFLTEVKSLGFVGVQNFPTVGLIDGVFRTNLEETGMGYQKEVHMIREAHKMGLLTTPYVFTPEDAREMTKAGADIIVAHMGLTTGGAIGAETSLTLSDCIKRIDSIANAALEIRDDVIILCHGGPIAEVADARYVLQRCKGIHGFYGASSIERLPTEKAIEEQVRAFSQMMRERNIYVTGTCDTKNEEMKFLHSKLTKMVSSKFTVVMVDVSATTPKTTSTAVFDRVVSTKEVARFHPEGEEYVFKSKDRGTVINALSEALSCFLREEHRKERIGGIIGIGGSGGTALITPALRALPIGVPKLMVSTVASSGDVSKYVGGSDIMMYHSVVDLSGNINCVSSRVLNNAAGAITGMAEAFVISQKVLQEEDKREKRGKEAKERNQKPLVALTMFGVTTPCVQQVSVGLVERGYEPIVFHSVGSGGKSCGALVDSGLVTAVLDITTTEMADEHCGGFLTAGSDRFDPFIRHSKEVPYIGSCGALDMVNFFGRDSIPEKYSERKLHIHNDSITLMRTTSEENTAVGNTIAKALNSMQGHVRFLIPTMGISAIDKEGEPFHDPEADNALFKALKSGIEHTEKRKLLHVNAHINDESFSMHILEAFDEIMGK